MVEAAVQHEIVMLGAAGAGEDLIGKIHAVSKDQAMHITHAVLCGKTLLTQDTPHQSLYPHFGLVMPFHQRRTAAVCDKDACRR